MSMPRTARRQAMEGEIYWRNLGIGGHHDMIGVGVFNRAAASCQRQGDVVLF